MTFKLAKLLCALDAGEMPVGMIEPDADLHRGVIVGSAVIEKVTQIDHIYCMVARS